MRIGLERGCAEDGELRLEAGQLRRRRDDEQVSDEQIVPGHFLDETHREAICGVGAGVEVLDEEFLLPEVRDQVGAERVVLRGLERLVDLAPPDVSGAGRLVDDELVVRRPAGVGAGAADEGTVGGDHPFTTPDGVLVENCCRKVRVDGLAGPNPKRVQSRIGLYRTHV